MRARTPLRKLLKRRAKRTTIQVRNDWLSEQGYTRGLCTCDHPRVRHVKQYGARRHYSCTVKGCKCYIAANRWTFRPRQGNGVRRRRI
jgi:hypothetical protein